MKLARDGSRAALEIGGWVLVAGLLPVGWVTLPGGAVPSGAGPDADRAALKSKLAVQEEELRHAHRLLAQVVGLETSFPRLPKLTLHGSRVLRAPDPTGPHRRFVLDGGAADGFTRGMPVLVGPAVVGKLFETEETRTVAITVCDPAFQAPAVIGRTGAEALVRGAGPGRLVLMPRDARIPIEVGDVVFTGPRSRSFPAGFYLGEVQEVWAAGGLPRAILAPAIDPDRVFDVMVLVAVPESEKPGAIPPG